MFLMGSLLHCPHFTELKPSSRLMGFSEALRAPRSPFCVIGSDRFVSPSICHHVTLGNVFRFMLWVGNPCSVMSPVMSAKNGHSTTSSEGLCKVVWTVEADLVIGQFLYVTGDLVVLGAWQPEMAILMCPTEHANLWKAEVEMPSGINVKYNYFIKEDTWPAPDIMWRPGPELSLSVPQTVKQGRNIIVRDSWINFDAERSPAHLWGSWIDETYPPVQPSLSASTRDEHAIVEHIGINMEQPKPFLNDLKVKDRLYSIDKDTSAARHDGRRNSILSEGDQPVEEPWLLQSSIAFLLPKDKMIHDMPKNVDATNLNVTDHVQVKDKLLPAGRSNMILKNDSVSTVILINSSVCTLQRIAILEDGKLVELLLEPVKSNVQCDSVYLGLVSKLVPHMGGAFVNIENSKPSFMDIKKNREPFIFPPFLPGTKSGETNGSVTETLDEHPDAHENDHTSHEIDVVDDVEFTSQDGLVPFLHDEHEDYELDDSFDISEVKENVNSSLVNLEHLLNGRMHDLDGEIINCFSSVETEGSNDSLVSHLPHMKDARHVLTNENKWAQVRKGTKIIVQVVKEGLRSKSPTVTAYPILKSRFWILTTRCDKIAVSKKISSLERTRLKVIAKTLQPPGFGLTVRTVAAGHSLRDLEKDLLGLLSTWKNIMKHAKSAALAADEGVEGAVPVMLHRAMGQTLSVAQDYFNEKVEKMVVDSPRTYHEVTNYLQEIAPDLCDRVQLYDKRIPIFDEFNIEEEINSILSKRVMLPNGGSLVIEQTEALVSIDVNGGLFMLGQDTSQGKAILDVNLTAARQIARELRLRDIGGIIVVDFIDMVDDSNKRLVYEEMKRAVERDRSVVTVSELSKHGLMEITRQRVRPSVTDLSSEPCTCCHATGRVEALETSFLKIEQEICRLLAVMNKKAVSENPKTWPKFVLRVDRLMCDYLASGTKKRVAMLSSSLKVWIYLKVDRKFTRGAFEVKQYVEDKRNKSQQQVGVSVLPKAKTTSFNSGRKPTLVPVKRGKAGGK